MKPYSGNYRPPGGWILLTGTVILAALIPLVRYPSLSGAGVVPFLCSFCTAGLAYVLALKLLPQEKPSMSVIWGFAVLFRLVLLLTPVSLSEDVYRYVWDGHLLNNGMNPYAEAANSPLLDAYTTPLRERVNYPELATPYLPAAEVYFALVERIAPQTPSAFQAGAVVLDLAAAGLLLLVLRKLYIPAKVILVYLWNPLVVVEFAHGAHIDVLMVFLVAAGLWGFITASRRSLTFSAVAWAAAVLVKGWPLLAAPLMARRWGMRRTVLFTACVVIPLVLFAVGAGWGLSGPANGRGVFGAIRLYTAAWVFNSGLYLWVEKLLGAGGARAVSLAVPALAGLLLGWKAWRREAAVHNDPATSDRALVRWAAIPFGLYLTLAPTVHPWYLTLMLLLLTLFWPALGEDNAVKRWIWPWVYFMFFEAFTYLTYSGVTRPEGLELIQTAAYLPFWGLLIWAAWRGGLRALDLSLVSSIIIQSNSDQNEEKV